MLSSAEFTGIQAKNIRTYWPFVKGYLQNGLGEGESVDELFEALLTKRNQLWVGHDGYHIGIACATEVVNIGTRKVCNILTIGGDRPSNWQTFMNILETWAKVQGCHAMRFPGVRLGWKKILKDYKVTKITVEKGL
jgi:hypothetical protein